MPQPINTNPHANTLERTSRAFDQGYEHGRIEGYNQGLARNDWQTKFVHHCQIAMVGAVIHTLTALSHNDRLKVKHNPNDVTELLLKGAIAGIGIKITSDILGLIFSHTKEIAIDIRTHLQNWNAR